ncbi:MAG: hypothetical protein IRY83_18040 [Chloroflexi bacterium]|nr:hypothetical protein [Chloroflexota bacterium]
MRRLAVAALAVIVLSVPVFATASAPWGTYDGHTVVRVLVNGQEVKGDVPASIYGGRTLVPLRLVAEAFGAKVELGGRDDAIVLRPSSLCE